MQVDELLKPFPIKEFHPFPRALMGPGAHEMIGPEALKMGFRKTLVMTSGLRGTDIVTKIVESMKYHGLEVVVYDKVESNPKDYNCMDAAEAYRENKCDSFVSIGGGSSHDATKGARLSLAHDGRSINEFEGYHKVENPDNPPHISPSSNPFRLTSGPAGVNSCADRTLICPSRSSPQPGNSSNRAQSRVRSSPVASRARTVRVPSARSTLASGIACRLSHQAGWVLPQPFMAMVTRFGPSS